MVLKTAGFFVGMLYFVAATGANDSAVFVRTAVSYSPCRRFKGERAQCCVIVPPSEAAKM